LNNFFKTQLLIMLAMLATPLQAMNPDLTFIDALPSQVCSGVSYNDASGSLQTGTKSCPAQPDCVSDNQTGCKAVASFPAADIGAVANQDIRVGTTVLGVAGSLKANCRNMAMTATFDVRILRLSATPPYKKKGQHFAGIWYFKIAKN
jgi:hypothetical protein